jgi:hypothetical protein
MWNAGIEFGNGLFGSGEAFAPGFPQKNGARAISGISHSQQNL